MDVGVSHKVRALNDTITLERFRWIDEFEIGVALKEVLNLFGRFFARECTNTVDEVSAEFDVRCRRVQKFLLDFLKACDG